MALGVSDVGLGVFIGGTVGWTGVGIVVAAEVILGGSVEIGIGAYEIYSAF